MYEIINETRIQSRMEANIVQLNNQYINDENTKKRYMEEEENRKRNRLWDGFLIVVMLCLFCNTT